MMADRNFDLDKFQSTKSKALIVGAVLGALVGAGAAYLMIQKAEAEGEMPDISPGEGMRLGLLVLGLLRQVAALGEEK